MEVISSKISLPTSDTTQMETDDKSEKEELRLNLDESDSDDELIVSRGVKIYQKTKAKAFDSDDEDNSHLLTNLPVPSNEMDTSEDSQLFKEVNKSSRRFLLKDSDDEDEKPLSKLELIDNKNSSNGETVVTKKKRIFTHSSDSEDEVPLEETVANSSCKNSTDESESEITKENEKPTWLNFDSSNITETTKGKRKEDEEILVHLLFIFTSREKEQWWPWPEQSWNSIWWHQLGTKLIESNIVTMLTVFHFRNQSWAQICSVMMNPAIMRMDTL